MGYRKPGSNYDWAQMLEDYTLEDETPDKCFYRLCHQPGKKKDVFSFIADLIDVPEGTISVRFYNMRRDHGFLKVQLRPFDYLADLEDKKRVYGDNWENVLAGSIIEREIRSEAYDVRDEAYKLFKKFYPEGIKTPSG